MLLLLTSSQTCPIIKLAALFDLRCPSHSTHILYIPLIAPKTRLTPNTHIHQLSHMRANVVVRAATRDLPKVYLSYNGCLSFCRSAKKKKGLPRVTVLTSTQVCDIRSYCDFWGCAIALKVRPLDTPRRAGHNILAKTPPNSQQRFLALPEVGRIEYPRQMKMRLIRCIRYIPRWD